MRMRRRRDRIRETLFAYGSLVDPISAAATLGRQLDPAELVLAVAPGGRRRFSVARDNLRSEKTFALADGTVPPTILGLNLEPDAGAGAEAGAEPPNGLLIPLDEGDLERLDRRELRYRRMPIAVEAAERCLQAWTYTARAECFAPSPPPGAVILRAYAEAIEAAFGRLGPGQLDRYRRTTLPLPAEIVEATLVADRIEPGNPRAW